MRLILWCCVAFALSAGSAAVQEKPDFSGQWILVSPADAPATIPIGLSVTRKVLELTGRPAVRIDPAVTLTVVRRFADGLTAADTYMLGVSGGMVSGVGEQVKPRQLYRFSSAWDGDRFVIKTMTYKDGSQEPRDITDREEVWTLDAEGRLILTVTIRAFESEPTTMTATYTKR